MRVIFNALIWEAISGFPVNILNIFKKHSWAVVFFSLHNNGSYMKVNNEQNPLNKIILLNISPVTTLMVFIPGENLSSIILSQIINLPSYLYFVIVK